MSAKKKKNNNNNNNNEKRKKTNKKKIVTITNFFFMEVLKHKYLNKVTTCNLITDISKETTSTEQK